MEEKINKINWLDNILGFLEKNSGIILIIILIFALILRLKYLTINQAVWYDEAEYLSAAKNWAFGYPSYELHYVRPALLPFVMFILYKVGATEIVFRILILIFSMIGVIFTYLVGKELFDKRIALIATTLISFFYVHLFYTARIMTDIPSAAMWLVSLWLFWKGYILKESKIYLWLFGFFIIVTILMRFPAGLLMLIIILFLSITEKLKFLRNKDLWTSFLIAVITLFPYSLWYYLTYNKIPIIGAAEFYQSVNYLTTYLQLLPNVIFSPIPGISNLSQVLGNYLVLLFIVGLGTIIFNLIIGYDMIIKDKKLNNFFFIILWLVIPFIYFAFFAGQVPEDRYLIYIYPVIFYFVGFTLITLSNFLKRQYKYGSFIGIIIIIFVIISTSITQAQYADKLIKIKSSSYIEFRQAGNWIKENSNKEDRVIAAGVPQLSYYSEREIIYWPDLEEFEKLLQEDKSIKYIILSRLEGSPEWSYRWPEENKGKVVPVQAYLDKNQQPILVIYQLIDK